MNNHSASDCGCNLNLQATKLHQIKNSLSKMPQILGTESTWWHINKAICLIKLP